MLTVIKWKEFKITSLCFFPKHVYDVKLHFNSLLCFRKINIYFFSHYCSLYLFTHFLRIKSLINKYNTKTHLHSTTVLTRFVNHCVTVLYLVTANYHISLTRPCDSSEALKGEQYLIIIDNYFSCVVLREIETLNY